MNIRWLRSAWLPLLTVAFAAGAEAATLTMSGPDRVAFFEPFAITITADSEGDIGGNQVFVVLAYDPFRVEALGGGSADTFTQFDGAAPATVGANQGSCGWANGRDDQCLVFDQLINAPSAPVDAGPVVATLWFRIVNVSPADFAFQDAVPTDFIFFDFESAPEGWTVRAGDVPEPSTALLLAAGLVAVGAGRRARWPVR